MALALALTLLVAVNGHETLAPDSALTEVGVTVDADQDGKHRVDEVGDSFADLLATIGTRMWNETTEKEQSTVNATLDSVRSVIEGWVKQDFATSQQGIANQVQALVAKTSVAIGMKNNANDVDLALVNCRGNELELLVETQERLNKVNSIREEKEAVCREMRDTQNFTWELVSVPSGLCDFSDVTTEGVCTPFAELQKEVAEKDALVDVNQSKFQELQSKCNQLMDDLDNIIRETTLNNVPGNTAYTKKRLDCDQFARQATLSQCTFGDRLQEKCQAKTDADGLVVKVYHQQEDRIAQWSSSQLIKCKLLRFQNGETLSELNVSVIPEPLANCAEDVYVNKDGVIKKGCVHAEMPIDDLPCELAVDFQRDVGTMDYMLNAIDSQMSEGNFACNEADFKFSGFKWATGADPSDYVKNDFAAAATLSPLGAHPFSFCGEVAADASL